MFVRAAWKSRAGALAVRTVNHWKPERKGKPFLPFRAPEEKPEALFQERPHRSAVPYTAHLIII